MDGSSAGLSAVDSYGKQSVKVRLAEPADAEKIRAVINRAFRPAEGFFVDDDRINVAGVLSFLDTGRFLLAENEQQLVGCVYVEPRPTSNPEDCKAYLGLLAVDPAYQQCGFGSMLMDAAEDYSRALGAAFMDIKVVSLREGLFGYYRRRGYVETGTSPFPAEVVTKVSCHFVEMSKPLNHAQQTDGTLASSS
jgi:predicted N-acetyltransferase YhbS